MLRLNGKTAQQTFEGKEKDTEKKVANSSIQDQVSRQQDNVDNPEPMQNHINYHEQPAAERLRASQRPARQGRNKQI